ncbi:MAG: BACON domain-containing carbohydrate-binding protein [Bacteroidales bacterium]|nr:BACON domain-containing carbohydrate-binding protein [Bacteroidales bacterium]MDD6623107.1 BACON domain-containing carbohydrate-binding protein [Bacteroidales bacterium]
MKSRLKKLFCLSLLSSIAAFVVSCSDEPSGSNNNENGEGEIIAVNITAETENADALFLADDGSNVLVRINYGSHGVFRYDFGVGEESLVSTIIVDEQGLPEMMEYSGCRIFFKNITDTDFDCAIVDSDGEISYHWDIPFTFEGTETTRGLSDLWETVTSPFTNWYRDVSNGIRNFSWDEHSKKMLLPYTLKVYAFTCQALYTIKRPTNIISVFSLAVDEGYKSGMWNSKTPQWFNDANSVLGLIKKEWSGSKYIYKLEKMGFYDYFFNYACNQVIANADAMYEAYSTYQPEMEPIFEGEEWQIKLGTSVIDADAEGRVYEVPVNTIANWTVEGGASWCKASRQGNVVRVEVDGYEGVDSRTCSFKIKTVTYTPEIADAKLFVVQDGVVFKVEPSSLSFAALGTGLTRGVAVTTNDNITSWEVTSYPDWIEKIEKSSGSFFVTAKKNDSGGYRTGVLTVTGYVKGGTYIDRVVSLKQLPYGWDGTSWHFSGTLSLYMNGETISQPFEFDTGVINLAKGEINNISPEYKVSMKTDEEGRLIVNYTYSFSDGFVSGKEEATFIYERTGDTIAKCTVTIKANGRVDGESVSASGGGVLYGTLVNSDQSDYTRSTLDYSKFSFMDLIHKIR